MLYMKDYRPVDNQPMPRNCDPQIARRIWELARVQQIDEAVDYTARVCKATVAEFLCAPGRASEGSLPLIDAAVEFFVPPQSLEKFTSELDRALIRRSLEYSAARRSEQIGAIRVITLPPGAFHQWRIIWKMDAAAYHQQRWHADRTTLESLIRQADEGFRELLPIA
jgi:hypothetical protein